MKSTGLVFVLLSGLAGQAFSQQAKLDVTTFVVLGEGLSAGMADFSLRDVYQSGSFPALMAQQMKTTFPQPLLQAPGLGNVPGFPNLPVRVPAPLQTTLRVPFPPPIFVLNLSVPGYKVADSLSRRPSAPLVRQDDAVQTSANFILGFPAMALGKDKPLWTQVEYAKAMNPTFAVVALGYYDVLEGAVTNNPALLTDTASFQTNYNAILAALKGSAQVIALSIPNPLDTAYFTSLTAAGRLVGAGPDVLTGLYGLKSDDLITPTGLMAIASQLYIGQPSTLPAGSIVSGATAAAVAARVQALNAIVTSAAQQNGSRVFDLNGLFSSFRAGVTAGSKVVTADYMGGLYSLDGFYPGLTGHAVIANALLTFVNSTYGQQYPLVNVSTAAANDPAGRFTPLKRAPERSERQ